MSGHVALYFTLLVTNYLHQWEDDGVTQKFKKKSLMRMRRIRMGLALSFVITHST